MFTKETAKKEIENLVKKYELLLKEGRIGEYNESNTRKDFILPLFSALGWEVNNINEVQEETRISRDRVDYSFNLSSIPKFYLEAKALKADLDKLEYAQQAIDYAYNKGVPWAVLTDFEKIKVFNAEWKAKTLQDSQFLEITYNEYLERFDELWLLSKESLTQGLLDKEAERRLKKDKKQPISKQILADLLKAREKLTKNILQHPRLNRVSGEELDESVQRILDRLIFIRTCEDRVIEPNHLLSAVRLWRESRRDLSPALQKIFRDFNTGYNSRLFEEHFCENLVIDDKILAGIIKDLYETPDGSRYDFSVISADVLGSIYEQYLGHILKKTPKSARLKETHRHRKEMGIYYTPTYIVDYIVKNRLGEILKKAKPKEAMKIRVLDPACGSGSFLIRAFDEFVNYWQKKSPGEFGYFRKIEILKNNLYGVDLDKQAVEIAQMNLLLKTLYHRERLPMLEHIKQGNSLISGSEDELKEYFGENWQSKHPFNWEEEFPEIFSNGCHSEAKPKNLAFPNKQSEESQDGFDVVISNPPYERTLYLEDEKHYYSQNYASAYGAYDIFVLFIEKAIKLLKDKGYLGFIVSNKFLVSDYGIKLREFILSNCRIVKVVDLADAKRIFPDALVSTVVIILQKTKERHRYQIKRFIADKNTVTFDEIRFENLPVNRFVAKDGTFNVRYDVRKESVYEKINHLKTFGEKFDIRTGVMGFEYWKMEPYIHEGKRSMKDIRIATNSYLDKYCFLWSKKINLYKKNFTEPYVNIEKIPVNDETKKLFLTKKLLVRGVARRLTAMIDNEGIGFLVAVHSILTNVEYEPKFVLGLLNSKLFDWIHKDRFYLGRIPEGSLKYPVSFLKGLPLPPNISKTDKENLVKLVDRMLELNKELQKFGDKLTDERRKIESEIQKTDREIDRLAYELYGLSEKEIKIIEGSKQ